MGKSGSSMIIISFDILWLHKPCRGNAIAKSQQTIPLPSMSNVTLTPVYAARWILQEKKRDNDEKKV
jgi:hypothetical protein